MAETAKDAFASRNFGLAAEMFERCLRERGPHFELYCGYGNSLARCGRLREAVDVFSHCCRLGTVAPDRLRHLAAALCDAVLAAVGPRTRIPDTNPLACVACDCPPTAPLTLACGHTLCRRCLARECPRCGLKVPSTPPHNNVLVQKLVERWWGVDSRAAQARDMGNELFTRGRLNEALAKYNEAVQLAPNNHLLLSNRSHALFSLHRLQEALEDADAVVRLRPWWGKGHYRRGMALSALGRLEDALVALSLCVALDRNPNGVRREMARVLQQLLRGRTRGYGCTPYSRGNRGRRSRHHQAALSSSDCEDGSSGEEDHPLAASTSQENSRMHSLLDRVFQEVDKIRRFEPWNTLSVDPHLVDEADFECVLCCRTFWCPITIPCGHTYCRTCLDRCLDYGCSCPLCMASLADFMTNSQKSVTEFIERSMQQFLPGMYAARQAAHAQEMCALLASAGDTQIPLFICITSFPSVACPLFVYEPRYRVMIRRCIEAGVRKFGIVSSRGQDGRFAQFGTVLEIKDWMLRSDGCSFLSTIGGRRFRVLDCGETDGYNTARVEFFRDQPVTPDQLPSLKQLHERVRRKSLQWLNSIAPHMKAEIERSFGDFPAVEDDWLTLPDGPAWAWWLLPILPFSEHLRVTILSTTTLEKRLQAINLFLERMNAYLTGNPIQENSARQEPEMQVYQESNEDNSDWHPQETNGYQSDTVRVSQLALNHERTMSGLVVAEPL